MLASCANVVDCLKRNPLALNSETVPSSMPSMYTCARPYPLPLVYSKVTAVPVNSKAAAAPVAVSAENGDQVSPSLAGQPNVLRLARTCLTCGLRETSAVRLKRLLDGTGVR